MEMVPAQEMTMERRIELIEKRQRHMFLELALCVNYMRLLAAELGLRREAAPLNSEWDELLDRRHHLGLAHSSAEEPAPDTER